MSTRSIAGWLNSGRPGSKAERLMNDESTRARHCTSFLRGARDSRNELMNEPMNEPMNGRETRCQPTGGRLDLSRQAGG